MFPRIYSIDILSKINKDVWKLLLQITLHIALIVVIFNELQYYISLTTNNMQTIANFKKNQACRQLINFPSEQIRPYDQYLVTWWTDRAPLSNNRIKNFPTMVNSKLKVIFIDLDSLDQLILKDFPIHPAFQYLSGIQKGDYLKAYFMNFYGGGYSDLKEIEQSFVPGRDKLRQNTSLFGVGYYQIAIWSVARDPADIQFQQYLKKDDKWSRFIGNGNYIFRPMTQFTIQWYNRMIALMEQKKGLLEKYPAKHGRQVPQIGYPYPIRWGQLNGWIFAKVQQKYGHDTVSDGIPYVIMKDHI